MHFQPMPVGFEPRPDLGVLVVGGVVLNQDRPLAAVSPSQLFEEAEIRGGIEDRILAIIEPRAPEFDGTENLHVLAFPRHGNFRWAAYSAPGIILSRRPQGHVPARFQFCGNQTIVWIDSFIA